VRILKKISTALAIIAIVGALISLGYVATIENNKTNTAKEISQATSLSDSLTYAEQQVALKSRLSAVRIVSMSPAGTGISSMSGTYFSLFDRHYVLTVMHGITGACEYTKVLVGPYYYDCLGYVSGDSFNDYMIMEVEEIEEKKPLDFFTDIPWLPTADNSPALLEPVYYTGFPNTMGPFTIRGEVMGYDALGTNHIYILSYAWMGASGSGVFNARGNLIGYVLAIDVGQTEFGVQILENVVMIGPTSQVDWRPLFTEFYK
jgi:hypothetical protein